MNHEMLLGPAIGFFVTIATLVFVAATARGMELRFQTTIAADPDAFMNLNELGQSPAPAAPVASTTIAGLAPPNGQSTIPDAQAVAPEAPVEVGGEPFLTSSPEGPDAPPTAGPEAKPNEA